MPHDIANFKIFGSTRKYSLHFIALHNVYNGLLGFLNGDFCHMTGLRALFIWRERFHKLFLIYLFWFQIQTHMENTAKFKWLIEMEHKPIESYLQKLFFFAFALAEQKKFLRPFIFRLITGMWVLWLYWFHFTYSISTWVFLNFIISLSTSKSSNIKLIGTSFLP